ncbi:MAG: class I SAM-dependent methyltransferase [Verrucomicrobiota bacterium]|nr:class I SAM-dependent methyltransferase [Verrucomicrobiota bacterium]
MPQHRRALQFISKPGKALDVGCGSSGRIIDLLMERGFEVEGIDISAEMIRLARQRHPQVVFHHADVIEWMPTKAYDFISAWDSVWHVPLTSQEAVWTKLLSSLSPGGVMILSSGGLDEAGEVQNAHMGVPMYHATPGLPALCRLIAEAACIIRHLEYDQWPEKHLVVVVQRV